MSEPTEEITVDDPIVRRLLPAYLDRRRDELVRLEQAFERGDYATLRVAGHNIAGSGGAYGLGSVSELGAELEAAAEGENAHGTRAALDGLADFLARVRIR